MPSPPHHRNHLRVVRLLGPEYHCRTSCVRRNGGNDPSRGRTSRPVSISARGGALVAQSKCVLSEDLSPVSNGVWGFYGVVMGVYCEAPLDDGMAPPRTREGAERLVDGVVGYFLGAGGAGSAEAWSAAYFQAPSCSTATAHQVPVSVVGAPPAFGTVVTFQVPHPDETWPAER